MKVETQLPLGKLDPGLRSAPRLDLASVQRGAHEIEALGFDGFVTGELKTDPFLPLGLAAAATERISLTTAVAIAFPRSPTVTAMLAWDLQTLSRGRFILGLGTQVKGHIERRYGVPWAPPVPRLREYIKALRAVWDCWQRGTPLDVRGAHYNLSLMVPLFDPGPIEHPRIPIHVAAINEHICRLAGEVCDGIRPHPITTPKFIREVMLRDGLQNITEFIPTEAKIELFQLLAAGGIEDGSRRPVDPPGAAVARDQARIESRRRSVDLEDGRPRRSGSGALGGRDARVEPVAAEDVLGGPGEQIAPALVDDGHPPTFVQLNDDGFGDVEVILGPVFFRERPSFRSLALRNKVS